MPQSLINQAGRALHQPPAFEANPFSCPLHNTLRTPFRSIAFVPKSERKHTQIIFREKIQHPRIYDKCYKFSRALFARVVKWVGGEVDRAETKLKGLLIVEHDRCNACSIEIISLIGSIVKPWIRQHVAAIFAKCYCLSSCKQNIRNEIWRQVKNLEFFLKTVENLNQSTI